uniref:NB-ARC domain-containing protein n=1 Tax=Salix viminalis TaxID=40686 RepID=A0A6N2K9I8_SALVM
MTQRGGIELAHITSEHRPLTEQLCSSSDNVIGNNMENPTTGFMQPGAGASSSGGLEYYTILTIGIYGIEGVGKTTKLQHIHNELLGRLDISHNVYGVTVSRDFSIDTLQNLITKRLDLDPSSKDNDRSRAASLASYRMNCRHKIKVMPLSDGEAQTLLMEELGHDIALSPEVEKLQ